MGWAKSARMGHQLTNIIACNWQNGFELQNFQKLPTLLPTGRLQLIYGSLNGHIPHAEFH